MINASKMRPGQGAQWLLAAACVAPAATWLATIGHPTAYLRLEGMPAGQQLYVIAKLMGLLGFYLFWAQCMLALTRRVPLFRGFPASDAKLHRMLGLVSISAIVLHAGLFVAASALRTGAWAWDLLLPSIDHGYYRNAIGLGAVAIWIALAAVFAGWRVSLGRRGWKRLHMLWPVVFGLSFLHAIAIGTESRYGALRYITVAVAVALAVVALRRIWRARRLSAAVGPWA